MNKKYDVIIVGAGPGGLMAAKVAGENGLKVALLDRKERIVEIGRCCATMFAVESDYYFGERMYFNEKQGRFVFPVTGFSLKYDGPYHNFYGWHVYTSDAKHYIKLGNYDENVKKGDQGRLSVTYSKSHLLKVLLNDAKESGVDVYPGTNVVDIRCNGEVNEVITSEGKVFQGVFTIAADGINSRLAKILNLNKERRFYGTMQGVSYYMSGLDLPHPDVLVMAMLYHKKAGYPVAYWIEPSPFEENEYWVYGGGAAHPDIDYKEYLDFFIYESPFSKFFERPRIRKTMAHVANMWSPVPTPFRDNVLIVGDAGWTVEAECTGSMMCGMKAANALSEAFKDGKLNREGVGNYIDWWQESFPETQNYREFLEILSGTFIGEDAFNYLYSLVTETLPCTLNPFNLVKYINAEIVRKMDKIQREKPIILEKMKHLSSLSLETQMEPFIKSGFPNF
jgi:digeranylgeranylglycerophospholipid reductase